jgi:predicted transcriptional regulator
MDTKDAVEEMKKYFAREKKKDGWTIKEIAKELNITQTEVKELLKEKP